ncbi:MAG TPA: energy transducer TonB, partial [Bacteroidetes bacterium]|nr:energy transducer TonB [Bacteroidota bacterium]
MKVQKSLAALLSALVLLTAGSLRAAEETKQLPVVFYAVYVFHAAPDGDILTYRWTENFTSVFVMDKMARNTAELVETLRKTYAFRQYTLLKTYSAMQLYAPDFSTTTVWAAPQAGESIELKGDKIGVSVNAPFPPEAERSPLQLAIGASDYDRRKTILRVSVVTTGGKTVVAGDQFPPPPVYGLGPREALFVAVTPFPLVLRKPQDLSRAARVLQRVRELAPASPERGPVAKDGLWRELVRQAKKVWGEEIEIPQPKATSFVSGRLSRISVSLGPGSGKRTRQPKAKVEVGGVFFTPYDFPPEPIGGFKAIQKHLKYPEIARRDSIEGRVIVHVLVDENGNAVDAKILKSLRKDLDEAAVEAVKSVKWRPALQRNIPVKVWVAVPVIFRLKKTPIQVVPRELVFTTKKGTPAFTSYDTAPEPIGGFEAIQKQLSKEMIHRCSP